MDAAVRWATHALGFAVGAAAASLTTAAAWNSFDSPLPTLALAAAVALAATFVVLRAVVSGDAGYGDVRWPRLSGLVVGMALGAVATSVTLVTFTHGGSLTYA